jgi:hypothetical protein
METECVSCEVGAGFLNTTYMNFGFQSMTFWLKLASAVFVSMNLEQPSHAFLFLPMAEPKEPLTRAKISSAQQTREREN